VTEHPWAGLSVELLRDCPATLMEADRKSITAGETDRRRFTAR
jgi:hypothetical protein